MQAVVGRHVAVKDITTVVVTSTIAGLAADSFAGAGKDQPWRRRAGAILLIGCGALVGALLLLHVDISAAVFLSAVLTAAVAFGGHRWGRV
jgi:hypothetical protein